MTTDPTGDRLDPETLAAYIDGRLTGADRAAVEARLAADEDAYELLVGVMRTEDAMAPAPRREVRWAWMAGSVAAAAAAVVLAVRLLPAPASDDRLAPLVTAVNGERYVEPRISGGFPAGPVRAVTRGQDPSSTRGVGGLSSQNLALVAAVAQAQARAQAEPTAPKLHVLGVGLLLLGDRDQAIDTLEAATASEAANAALLSDLAAAYAVRAAATASASDWSNALDRADRAIRLDESVVEAYFNRALALEALGLDSARAAWQSFLDRDSTSEWAREARAHLARLSERPQSRLRESNEQAILAALASGAGLDDAVRRDPQRVRELLEEDLSREWADAVVSGDAAAESRARMRGSRLLAAYATVVRDALPADALNHLRSRVVHRARVAAAIREYADAARLVREDRLAESSAALANALPVLQASGSPLALWARDFIVLEWLQQGKLTEAFAELYRIAATINGREYRVLTGAIHDRRGVIYGRQGNQEGSIRERKEAIPFLERAADTAATVGLDPFIGDNDPGQHGSIACSFLVGNSSGVARGPARESSS